MGVKYCKAMVPVRPHYIRYYQCQRKAREGSDYCWQHRNETPQDRDSGRSEK